MNIMKQQDSVEKTVPAHVIKNWYHKAFVQRGWTKAAQAIAMLAAVNITIAWKILLSFDPMPRAD